MNPNFEENEEDDFDMQNIPEIHFDCQEGEPMNTFDIVPETVAFLKQIDGGVAICSIVGKYRTGKSFLLNKIMGLSKEKGFIVSGSVNACTKGLWIWSKPIYNDKDNVNIFFMDTEGLDSIEGNSNIDHKLFALSVLLSSYFIYNSIGSIEENSINSLALITKLIKTVTINQGQSLQSEYELSQYAPKFLWIIRDFVLLIRDLKNRRVSSKMYLESNLSDLPISTQGLTRNSEESLKIRKSILSFFKYRDCVTLIRPVDDENDLRNIQYIDDSQIKQKFLQQLNIVRDKIYRECQQKVINGIGLNMKMFVTYLKEFVDSFNSGKMPSIQSAWENLMENECIEIYEQSIQLYEQEIQNFKDNNDKIEQYELQKFSNQLIDYTMNYYSKCNYIQDRNPDVYLEYKDKLFQYIQNKQEEFCFSYNEKSNIENQDRFNNLFLDIIQKNNQNVQSEVLIQDINDKLDIFQQDIIGGNKLKVIVNNIGYNSQKLFDHFIHNNQVNLKKKQKDIIRKQQIEQEKYDQEWQNIQEEENRIMQLIKEKDHLEQKVRQFKMKNDNQNKYQELIDKNSELKLRLTDLESKDRTNIQLIQKQKQELEKKKKKKTGFKVEKQTDKGLEEAQNLEGEEKTFYLNLLDQQQQEVLKEQRIAQGLKEKQDYSDYADENSNWIFDNRQKVIYILVTFVFTVLVLLIGWKMYTLNKANFLKNLILQKQAQQMEDILSKKSGDDKVQWSDQKGEMLYINNPCYKDQIQSQEISKLDILQQEIRNLEQDQIKKEEEIQKLEEKAQQYIDEIQELKQLYEENKKKVLQEGVPLGYADTVLREFK